MRGAANQSGSGRGLAGHEGLGGASPLDLEDGGTVVIRQQNAGPGNQVGSGEFKDDPPARRPAAPPPPWRSTPHHQRDRRT